MKKRLETNGRKRTGYCSSCEKKVELELTNKGVQCKACGELFVKK